jgi:hypothetical protein
MGRDGSRSPSEASCSSVGRIDDVVCQRVGRLGKGRAGQDRTGLDAEMEIDGVEEESSAAVSRAWRRLLFARAHGVRRSGQGGAGEKLHGN